MNCEIYNVKNEIKTFSFLFFKKICIIIISILITTLNIKEIIQKIFRMNDKFSFETKRFNLEAKSFLHNIFTNLDEKRLLNDTLTENMLFLQYKEEVQKKDEKFETNDFITVDFVKNIINEKKINNNYIYNDNITLNNVENHTTNNLYNYDNNYKIYKYIYDIIKEPLSLQNLKKFNISFNPKISVIIPSYNCEKYLKNIQRSIQDQSFEDIEIIYVDDCSTDNTSEIIKSFQEVDHRIVYLKNIVNKGLFYSRNKGAIFSRGKYIQFIDADDMLLNNILEKSLNIAEEKKVDIVQYATIRGYQFFSLINEKHTNKSLFLQPELSDEMFYGKGYFAQANYFIINKLIKKDKFYETLIFMEDYTLKEKLNTQEDAMTLFCLLRVANSLIIIEEIGYAYLFGINPLSLIMKWSDSNTANIIFHDIFIELRLIFKKTENNEHDKDTCFAFFKLINGIHFNKAQFVTKGYELFDEVFDLLLHCPFFKKEQKYEINVLKKKLMINRKSNNFLKNLLK